MKLNKLLALGALGYCEEFGEGQGGSALAEKDFQEKVLGGIGEVKKRHAEVETRLTEIDGEAKAAQETIAKAIDKWEATSGQTMELTKAIAKVQTRLATMKSGISGSSLEKILGDEEKKAAINAGIRGILNKANSRVAINSEQQKMFDEQVQKAVDTGSTPGSTYIDDDLNTDIYSLIAEYGVWNMFDVIPASTKTTKLIVDDTDPEMLFVDECVEPGEASYTGRTISAEVKKILGWISVSSEALEDSEIDLAGHILPKFANATALRIDHITLTADGTADGQNGGFTGIFAGGTAAAAEAGRTTVATTELDDWIKVLLSVKASVLSKPGAGWFIHPRQLVRLVGIKDDNGRPIFQNALEAPAPGAIGRILGYPVYLAHAAPSADGAGLPVAAFGDPMAMAVLLRQDLQVAVSEEAKFLEDKVVFRNRARVAAQMRDAEGIGVLYTAAG